MELKISKDIRTFKTKDVGMFSFKEAGYIAVAGILAYGGYIVEKNVLNFEEINVFLLVPLPLIVLCVGFLKPFGLTFPQFVRTVFLEWVVDPKIYVWESDFVYDLDGDNLAKDDKGRRRTLTDTEKQLYLMQDEVITEPLSKNRKELKAMERELQSHII